jgi:putative hydrolase of the HAD superfamily
LNIIFDLGGVVFRWEPDSLIKSIFDDEHSRRVVRAEMLDHPDWIELDRGTLRFDLAVERATERTGLPLSKIEQLLKQVPPSLIPIEDSVNLINLLKTHGHKIYILSNMHIESIDYLEQTYAFLHDIDGSVISCRIELVKPEIEIYKHIIEKYKLNPVDTIFIDDTSINLHPASNLGIKTIQFHTAEQCKEELKILACFNHESK